MPILEVDDLVVRIGRTATTLSPSRAFAVAEQLIRGATRAIVTDEADRAAVLGVMRHADRNGEF